MNAIILDTETNCLKGLPIEIAHGAFEFRNGIPFFDNSNLFEQYYSLDDGDHIEWGAMATHHIIAEDLIGQPNYREFQMPQVEYVIGHNIAYDLEVLARAGVDVQHIKPICTLKLAKHTWELDSYKLTSLIYYILNGSAQARDIISNAHRAGADICMTATLVEAIAKSHNIQDIEQLYQLSLQPFLPKVMPFGKHKGQRLEDVPMSYFNWLVKQDNVDPGLLMAIDRIRLKAIP